MNYISPIILEQIIIDNNQSLENLNILSDTEQYIKSFPMSSSNPITECANCCNNIIYSIYIHFLSLFLII
jgi:hypothetical protein